MKEDIAAVERRRQELLRAKDKYAVRVPRDLATPNLDTFSSKPGAISVWRGGQGGAFVPPSDLPFATQKKARTAAFAKKDGGFFNESFNFGESKGVSKKRRVLAQVYTHTLQFVCLSDAYFEPGNSFITIIVPVRRLARGLPAAKEASCTKSTTPTNAGVAYK